MKVQMRNRALLSALLLTTAAAPAPVSPPVEGKVLVFEPATNPGSVSAPLIREARITAIDLLRRVFPDLDNKGQYRTIAPVRPVAGATAPEMGAGYAQANGEPSLTMQPPTSAVVRGGRHAIAFVLGAGVLVSDWLLPAPAAGGALFVQIDPGDEPVIERAFPLREGEAAALVSNSHWNPGERVESYRLYAQGFSGLRQVYGGPSLYSYFKPDAQCENLDIRQSLTGIRPLAIRHGGYADIAMEVTESAGCTNNEDADSKLRKFHFTLTWDARAKRYRGGSPALERINKLRLND